MAVYTDDLSNVVKLKLFSRALTKSIAQQLSRGFGFYGFAAIKYTGLNNFHTLKAFSQEIS